MIDSIEYVRADTRLVTIKLVCQHKIIKLEAEGDCCSESWFECYQNVPFDTCIGKEYSSCTDTRELIEMPDSGVQDSDTNHVYRIDFTDGSSFHFLLRNSSNGYYDGWVNESIGINKSTMLSTRHQLIILVGLPGCGKSTYAKKLQNSIPNSIRFDDIDISLQTTIDRIRIELPNRTVIVANARFCILDTYNEFINRINLLKKDKVVVTYCFLPDVSKSIENIKNREKNETIQNKFIEDVHRYKNYYYVDHNTPFGINCKFIESYSEQNFK